MSGLAWLSTKVFLAIGQRLRATAEDGERFMLDFVAGDGDIETIAGWLAEHSSTARTPGPTGNAAGVAPSLRIGNPVDALE